MWIQNSNKLDISTLDPNNSNRFYSELKQSNAKQQTENTF